MSHFTLPFMTAMAAKPCHMPVMNPLILAMMGLSGIRVNSTHMPMAHVAIATKARVMSQERPMPRRLGDIA